MLRYGQSAGNIFNVEIPLTSLTKRKLPLGIVETNKLVRIIKVDTQTQQGNFQMWVPFSSVRWNTDDEDIDLLLTWAKSSIRKIGRAGHAPDTTGCTAQALLAVQHDFRQESVLSASQELTYYQGIQSGFTSAMVGNKGTMDFAQNPQSLLNYISPDKHLFQYIEIKTQYLPESNDFPFYPYTPPNESQHTTGADLLKSFMILLNANGLIIKLNMICSIAMKKPNKKKIFIIFILLSPVVHKICNSCCLSNFVIEIIRDNKKDKGTNREIIEVIFNNEY